MSKGHMSSKRLEQVMVLEILGLMGEPWQTSLSHDLVNMIAYATVMTARVKHVCTFNCVRGGKAPFTLDVSSYNYGVNNII